MEFPNLAVGDVCQEWATTKSGVQLKPESFPETVEALFENYILLTKPNRWMTTDTFQTRLKWSDVTGTFHCQMFIHRPTPEGLVQVWPEVVE